ncbi:MAG: hypothetical protein WD066_00405 [Planctomycetaceae bacterium]
MQVRSGQVAAFEVDSGAAELRHHSIAEVSLTKVALRQPGFREASLREPGFLKVELLHLDLVEMKASEIRPREAAQPQFVGIGESIPILHGRLVLLEANYPRISLGLPFGVGIRDFLLKFVVGAHGIAERFAPRVGGEPRQRIGFERALFRLDLHGIEPKRGAGHLLGRNEHGVLEWHRLPPPAERRVGAVFVLDLRCTLAILAGDAHAISSPGSRDANRHLQITALDCNLNKFLDRGPHAAAKRAPDALQSRRPVHHGTSERRRAEAGIREVGAGEIGPFEIRAGQVGSPKDGVLQVRPRQVRVVEVDVRQNRVLEIGP